MSRNPLEELLQLSGEEARLCELASEIGPVKEGSDGVEFRNELLKNESLKDWRELGKRNERGFKCHDCEIFCLARNGERHSRSLY